MDEKPQEEHCGGQNSKDENARPRMLNPNVDIEKHNRHLPHWQQGDCTLFITWRLADSLPQSKLRIWHAEKKAWLLDHPEPWSEETKWQYHGMFMNRMEKWLDAGEGACVLRDGAIRKIVNDSLFHFDGRRYTLWTFVIMPNHVHLLLSLHPENIIADVAHALKSYSSKSINRHMQRKGALWQEEYWDRIIRSRKHYDSCRNYIRNNPVFANIYDDEYTFYER